jgi:hypothetical protein
MKREVGEHNACLAVDTAYLSKFKPIASGAVIDRNVGIYVLYVPSYPVQH